MRRRCIFGGECAMRDADPTGSRSTDPRLRLMSLYADAHAVHELLVATDDEERSAMLLAQVIDLLEVAHAALYDKGGTAIVQPGQAEPV